MDVKLIESYADYEDVIFSGESLEKVEDTNFYDCRFEQCTLQSVQFVRCRFRDCVFVGCDLSLMRVTGSTFVAVHFIESHVIGVNWSEAAWPRFAEIRPINFTGCALNYSTFFGVKLKQCDFVDCVAKDVDFGEADLTEANCTGTDFAESRFLHTDLTRTNLRGAKNYAIDATANTVKGTKVSLPEALSLLYSLDIDLEK
ncbi:MAG: pentapeptide repeat-containing protein [Anaerolineae bacterium]|nr:pentapeptide repeat-containing protein [Anaerolineae bacterium]MCO5192769.1 pentapeptide repeat-containing protein [Anaerolineae bacterium]MCO5204538.1 pentapeptide repeat-containing protein [Anaerolineae bacterium]